jgi:hypothetical protein
LSYITPYLVFCKTNGGLIVLQKWKNGPICLTKVEKWAYLSYKIAKNGYFEAKKFGKPNLYFLITDEDK